MRSVSAEQSFAHIAAFGERSKLESSYAAKELADIGDILCPLVCTARPPISLARFKEGSDHLFMRYGFVSLYTYVIVFILFCVFFAAKRYAYLTIVT